MEWTNAQTQMPKAQITKTNSRGNKMNRSITTKELNQ